MVPWVFNTEKWGKNVIDLMPINFSFGITFSQELHSN